MSPEVINGIFVVLGALIGVIGTAIIMKKNKSLSHLTIFSSPSSQLLDIEDMVKSDIEIKYKGKVISELFHGEVAVQNTGTESLENLEVKLLPGDDSPLFDVKVSTTNYYQDDGATYIETNDSGEVSIDISYLNPNDRVVFSYRSSGSTKPTVASRKIGVGVEFKDEAVNWVPDIYAKLMYEIVEQVPILHWYLKLAFKPYRLYTESKKSNDA
ncbi:hypothetical protein ACI1G1_003367 [Vibrio cholerae]|uniref:hypothetical protein n=1 Tax=Vibrio diabolicus TaxID=50719 RepID=UPI00215FD745|nr:hypothetical protein [Vibrio diabolicus]MCS0401413.1 hypothetical protein [Vibrio diabolicus]